ncbi:MAG: hypothetical protein ICV84_24175 [Flavisolibacter sp.]|nr:hypothetical protein [Flavisolibacter sp.]
MERLQVLIDKLIEQNNKQEAPAKILVTVQLLQKELVQLQQRSEQAGTEKVAVVMPAAAVVSSSGFEERSTSLSEIKQPIGNRKDETMVQPDLGEVKKEEPPKPEPYTYHKQVAEVEKKEEAKQTMLTHTPAHIPFDAMAETPTLLQQPHFVKEIHEVIGERKESLNDVLKQDRNELAHVLKDAPIKDLRKAIGINDRFVFVNELFRGDEAMYDRSIKTINNFQILPEAEYWINRELKLKLGWNDNHEAVQHFYQLVRRRFS